MYWGPGPGNGHLKPPAGGIFGARGDGVGGFFLVYFLCVFSLASFALSCCFPRSPPAGLVFQGSTARPRATPCLPHGRLAPCAVFAGSDAERRHLSEASGRASRLAQRTPETRRRSSPMPCEAHAWMSRSSRAPGWNSLILRRTPTLFHHDARLQWCLSTGRAPRAFPGKVSAR